MPHAIRIHEYGGPETLRWDAIEIGKPGAGQVRLKQTAVGLNYIDTYHRTGLYKLPELPASIGSEGAGIVEEVGSGVTDLKAGDRVCYAGAPVGSYAEARLYPADRLIKIPDGIDDKIAAAMMLQGMTAQYLLKRVYACKKGDIVVMHAAAGGVGSIFCQWATALGVTVIGTVGSQAKAELAKKNGCKHVLVLGEGDWVARVKEISGGKGVPVIYDSIGKDTFFQSLDCLQLRGLMVTFGNASGPVSGVDLGILATKGSLYLTRPTLVHYIATRQELLETAGDLFDAVKRGMVTIQVNQTFPLRDAAEAHRALEGRKTTGSTVLLP
jgi:NADPH2:quinone reductase